MSQIFNETHYVSDKSYIQIQSGNISLIHNSFYKFGALHEPFKPLRKSTQVFHKVNKVKK